MSNITSVVMAKLPECDFCKNAVAGYDSVTIYGSWGYTCEDCQERVGAKALGLELGLGVGQKLIQWVKVA